MIEALNLGAGVQSTTLLLMSIHGELPKLDYAIFADTGNEPAAVYQHLDGLALACDKHGIELIRVKAAGGGIIADHLAHLTGQKKRVESMPFRVVGGGIQRVPIHDVEFILEDGIEIEESVVVGYVEVEVPAKPGTPILRKCTRHYKHRPIDKAMVRLRRKHAGEEIRRWLGISYDEQERMIDGFWHPLIEERMMSRGDCQQWLAAHGYSAPRSACIACPYHDNHEWSRMKSEAPREFAAAVAFDAQLRKDGRRIEGVDGEVYLHPQCVPLDQADISVPVDRQQSWIECTGGCFT